MAVEADAAARVGRVSRRTGLGLNPLRSITPRMQVLEVAGHAGEEVATTLARLRRDPDVEYASLDERRYAHQVTSDPLFPQQWYLQSDPATPAAIDAMSAWDTTTGSAGVVIADLDTGVRFNHPDLQRIALGGRLLPGYDFVSSSAVGNDNNGRDADALGSGGLGHQRRIQGGAFQGLHSHQQQLAWDAHRRHSRRPDQQCDRYRGHYLGHADPAGAGAGQVRRLRLDIQKAMLWAAGVHVNNVPDNPNPARILNMSFGSSGTTCPQSYLDVIQQVTELGVTVVVSAGNEGGPVDTPGNCVGVVTVAGLRQVGTKVGYSSLGPEVALSAPAGNCVNTAPGSACQYSILTTSNSGTTTPGTNTYTDQFAAANLGTSFSAPMVSGIAALMASANPNLNSCQMTARLKEGAQPFPQSSAGETVLPPLCHVPTGASDVQNAECVCTLDGKTCGAGMANARAAVAAAMRPIAAVSISASQGSAVLAATGALRP